MTSKVKDVLDHFGLDMSYSSGRFFGCCPIHNGDNRTAFSIYEESGCWTCFTHNCQMEHGGSLFGLIKALGGGYNLDFKYEARDFKNKIKNDQAEKGIPRKLVLEKLQIPSQYYLKRGFLEDTLKKYDVGYCSSTGKIMSGRNVIPVYNTSHTHCIGCTGRLDTNDHHFRWKHSKNFAANKFLYNSWYAKNHIDWGGKIILVEGPAKVWRLEESGIGYSVAIFGTTLGFEQRMEISKMGVNSVIILLDEDEAGKKAAANIAKELDSLYNVYTPKIGIKDIDRSPVSEIREKLLPILENIK